MAAISSLTTAESVALAKAAHAAGCDALMILPPYVYRGDWREMKTHVAAVFQQPRFHARRYWHWADEDDFAGADRATAQQFRFFRREGTQRAR